MKEYATLVVHELSEPFANVSYSGKSSGDDLPMPGQGRLHVMLHNGWEVIDSSCLPKLSTVDDRPRFAFILEREQKP